MADPDVDPNDPGGHVLQARFGLNQLGKPGPAEILSQELGDGSIKDGRKLQMLLRINYDQMYGIINHDDPLVDELHPLALVEQHEKEKVEPHTSLYRLMSRFVKYRVAEFTGMDFPTFITQPRDVCEHWLLVCMEHQRKLPQGMSPKDVKKMEEQLGGVG